MQPLVPLVAYRDPVTEIPIQEHLVPFVNQPLVELTGILTVFAGMTDEYPGHHPSQVSVNKRATTPHDANWPRSKLRRVGSVRGESACQKHSGDHKPAGRTHTGVVLAMSPSG
jgi:hypothetical protein